MSAVSSGFLDVNALVTQLMAATRAPVELRFDRREAETNAQLSAFGKLSSAFDALKTALTDLTSASTYGGRTATSGDESLYTATASTGATAGTYQVEVEAVASAHKLVSGALASGVGLGDGQLTIDINGVNFAVDISSGTDTPEDIRDAINTAAATAGAELTATIIEADGGQHLVLTAKQTGADYAITVTNTSAPANAAFDALTNASLTEQSAAQDARLYVDGILKTASSNTITDFIPGITFNLKAQDPGNVTSLSVAADYTPTVDAVAAFVEAYNKAVTTLSDVSKYNTETKQDSALTGDAAVRSAERQLRSALGNALSDAVDAGFGSAALGIDTKVDGTLDFDKSAFTDALSADPSGLQALFADTGGFADSLLTVVSGYIGTDGIFTDRTESLNDRLVDIDDDRDAAERRFEAIEARYRAQYTALDVLLAQSQNTSNFLAQQLAGLSRI
ncbi:MAG TPA: flagellar filament capping protein FliD [Arenimonas sp.]|nr:flagellar filament capping protein FliD [Arenimonas sp.]